MTDSEITLPPDSAIDPATGQEASPNASVPARAREARADPAIRSRGLVRRLGAYFDPPEIWDQPRPALQKIVGYAREAPWTGEGVARRLGIAYALLVAVPAHAAAYYLLWVLERPARGFCGLLLLAAVAFTPPGEHARAWLAQALQWIANGIT